jgi:2-dehydropantoate 2-reductase
MIEFPEVAPLDAWRGAGGFDVVLLATKAHDAIRVAPVLTGLLGPGGFLLPIQNGDVASMIAGRIGEGLVLGGLSNLGATMTAPGSYEQRNAGHLLVGELPGGESVRAGRVRDWFGAAVEVRVTPNIRGAVWAKLLLNCSVTTIGAIAARTMREYIRLPEGRALFDLAYAEALAVALASGIRPAKMIVDAVPPRLGRSDRTRGCARGVAARGRSGIRRCQAFDAPRLRAAPDDGDRLHQWARRGRRPYGRSSHAGERSHRGRCPGDLAR